MKTVYLVDGGDYSNYGWYGVYDSLDIAIKHHPLPEMRAIDGVQCDPTHALRRPGGWKQDDDTSWWNGFIGDFGLHIHAVPLVDE